MGRFTRKIAIAAVTVTVGFGGVALATTTASAAPAHVVTPGETLGGIAAANGTSVSSLVSLNDLSNPNAISVGQTLNVTGSTSAPAPQAQSAPVDSSSALDYIAFHESTNNPNAVNSSSGAYGLFQFLPGTGPGAGASVAAQYAAAHAYAVARYGSDQGAQAFWEAHSWW